MLPAGNPLDGCIGFDWDDANTGKSWKKHGVTPEEAEEVFFSEPFAVLSDAPHSARETRYQVLGQTAKGRKMFVAFTVRRRLIRVISARDMSRKERALYAEIAEANS